MTGASSEIPTRAIVDATGVWAAEPDHPFRGASLPHPAKPGRPPGRAARADPEQDGPDDPRPGQGRLPRPVARSLADRHDRRAVRRPGRAAVRGRLGGRPAARHGQRDDGRRPDAGRCGRHVRRAAAADRALRRLDRQGVARAPRHRRVERRRPHRRRQVHDLSASWRATSSTRSSGRPRRNGARATRPSVAWSAPPTRTRSRGSPASSRAIPAVREIGPETAARLVARHGTEAPAVVALGAELDLLRPLVPGRPFLEAEVAWAARHELALSLDDVLARRTRLAQELPDRGAAIAPRVAAILGAELGWDESRQRLEVDAISRRRDASTRSRRRGRPARPTAVPDRSTDGVSCRHRRRHGTAPSCAHGIPRRPATRVLRWPLHVSHPGRHRVDPRRGRRAPHRLAGGLVRGGAAPSRSRRAPARRSPSPSDLPLTYYLASPIWIRTELIEPDPVGEVVATPTPTPAASVDGRRSVAVGGRRRRPHRRPGADAVRSGARSLAATFHGTDDFHFGRGTATIIETAPGTFTLRLDGLLGPQRPRPVRLPLARCRGLRRRRARAGPTQGDRRRLRLRAPGGHGPRRLRQRDHLVQAVLAPLRGRSAEHATSAPDQTKVGSWQAWGKRVPSARKRHGGVRGQTCSLTQLGLLSRLTRDNPTGSRRLPRGVWLSCTTTRT